MAHPRPPIMQPMAEYNELAVPVPNNVLDTAAGSKQHYQRTYQACQPCRKRKVKCDLGSPENPHDPPCARCRREHKQCDFSLTRRKRKSSTLGSESEDEDPPIHLQRKRSARGELSPTGQFDGSSSFHPNAGDLQSASQTTLIGSGYGAGHGHTDQNQDEEVHNLVAADVFGPQTVTGPTDAMQSLINAVGLIRDEETKSKAVRSVGQGSYQKHHGRAANASKGGHPSGSGLLDPAITATTNTTPEPSRKSLEIWSRLRFVRAGWFTATEAAQYIEYYYTHLAPMTLVTHPDFRQIEDNPNLLSQEPMLAVTLLTIASRYMRVTGRGSETRSLMIHDRLWQFLQSMVTRMFWGQEQSGGGFCGAGTRRTASDTANLMESSKLRSLGSIESLLLLSDFHPRSIHFPPGDDDGELMVPDDNLDSNAEGDESRQRQINEYLQMFEPIGRSTYELGVFGTYENGKAEDGGRIKSTGPVSLHEQRMDRIDRLLYIYLTQASGRYGFPGIYPKHLANQYMADLHQNFPIDPTTLNLTSSDLSLYFCTELTSLNKLCNDRLFQSHEATERLIQTGEVMTVLSDLVPRLESWKLRLQNAPVDEDTKTLFMVEVNYFLCYVNGQGLQAWWTHFRSAYHDRHPSGDYQSPASSVSSQPSAIADQYSRYIIGCVDASREILQLVVVNLGKNGKLRHAPVRTILSITSAAMFLYKTFLRGNLRSSVNDSTRLLAETIRALRASVVDDVHLSHQWADILESINLRMSSSFMTLDGPTDSSPSQTSFPLSQSGTPPAKHHVVQKSHFKKKPRTGSFTTRPHPDNPDVNVVMPPPSRSMYQQQRQQQTNARTQFADGSGGETDRPIDDHPANNSNNQAPGMYEGYSSLYLNDNSNNDPNANKHTFDFDSNDDSWMGMRLDHMVNTRGQWLGGSVPPNFEFANPYMMDSGSSMIDLLGFRFGAEGFDDDYMQGDGNGGY